MFFLHLPQREVVRKKWPVKKQPVPFPQCVLASAVHLVEHSQAPCLSGRSCQPTPRSENFFGFISIAKQCSYSHPIQRSQPNPKGRVLKSRVSKLEYRNVKYRNSSIGMSSIETLMSIIKKLSVKKSSIETLVSKCWVWNNGNSRIEMSSIEMSSIEKSSIKKSSIEKSSFEKSSI